MTVQIVPRHKVGYSNTYDVCAVGSREVYNFPTYRDAREFCERCGFDVYREKSMNPKANKCRCTIYGLYKKSSAIRRAFGEQSFSYGGLTHKR